MTKNYQEMLSDTTKYLKELNGLKPDTIKAFNDLAKSVMKPDALDQKTKELIALSIAVTKRCDQCIAHHMKELVALSVTKQELVETLMVAVEMDGGPALMYSCNALLAYDQFSAKK